MIVSDLLAAMSVFNNELDLAVGGADEARAITALSMAQTYMETIGATMGGLYVTRGPGPIYTEANVESTIWPRELLRADAVWMLDAASLLPTYPLSIIKDVGGHFPALPWPLQLVLTQGSGAPRGYSIEDNRFNWLPLPNGAYPIRVYGVWRQLRFTDRNSPFTYDDGFQEPLAAFAVRRLKVGVDDDASQIAALAQELFAPALKALRHKDRTRPDGFAYTRTHDT